MPEALIQLEPVVNVTSKEMTEFGVDLLEIAGSGSPDLEEERKRNKSSVPKVTGSSFGEEGDSVEVAEVETTTLRQDSEPGEDYVYKFNSCADKLKNTLHYLKVNYFDINL